MPNEWVPTKAYAKWKPPTLDSMVPRSRGRKKGEEKKGEEKKGEEKPANSPSEPEAPLAIEGRGPRGNPGDPGPGKPRPHGGPEPAALEGRGPRGNPGDPGPGGPRPQGGKKAIAEDISPAGRTVAEQQANQEALGQMVRDVLNRRQHRQDSTGTTGEIVGEGRSMPTPRQNDTIHTGEVVSSGTKPIRALNPAPADAPTGPIRLNKTSELPAVDTAQTVDLGPRGQFSRVDQTLDLGRTPARGSTAKSITQRSEPFGQMSLFDSPDVPFSREQTNFTQAAEDKIARIASYPPGLQPGRQVQSWNARPTVNKAPGSQGVLVQPRKYR